MTSSSQHLMGFASATSSISSLSLRAATGLALRCQLRATPPHLRQVRPQRDAHREARAASGDPISFLAPSAAPGRRYSARETISSLPACVMTTCFGARHVSVTHCTPHSPPRTRLPSPTLQISVAAASARRASRSYETRGSSVTSPAPSPATPSCPCPSSSARSSPSRRPPRLSAQQLSAQPPLRPRPRAQRPLRHSPGHSS